MMIIIIIIILLLLLVLVLVLLLSYIIIIIIIIIKLYYIIIIIIIKLCCTILDFSLIKNRFRVGIICYICPKIHFPTCFGAPLILYHNCPNFLTNPFYYQLTYLKIATCQHVGFLR